MSRGLQLNDFNIELSVPLVAKGHRIHAASIASKADAEFIDLVRWQVR